MTTFLSMNRFLAKGWLFAAILSLSAVSIAHAKAYGVYDPRQLIVKNANGTGGTLNLNYVDRMLQDLRMHAEIYPATFDSEEDRARAKRDSAGLARLLDVMAGPDDAPADLSLRLGTLLTYMHNLDVSGAAGHAEQYLKRALTRDPSNVAALHRLGVLLANIGRTGEALQYLNAAKSGGSPEADYSLGLAYLTLGDKPKALEHLSAYADLHPLDTRASELIGSIREMTDSKSAK